MALMLDSACQHFPSIPRDVDVVTLQTNQLDVSGGYYADITAEIWDTVIHLLNVVEVTQREEMTFPVPLPFGACAISLPDNQSARDSSRDDDIVTISVVFPSGEIQTANISKEMRVDKFVADASQILGHCPTPIRAVLRGVIMYANRSFGSYNIEDGDSINLKVQVPQRVVRKPVIYLYSPSDIDVSVKVSLILEWSLSVIYPVVTTEDHGQRLEWNVLTHLSD
ncbi:hypothetical protein BDR03DRAFT_32712 [Suillus americanus]|nr:hypothetical protein BDR03DRAFT_32712 [Suillus americanus]